jgi:hypothetical protein
MSDDKRDLPTADEILSSVEHTLDAVAEDHKDHDCGTADLALRLSAGVKLKREALGAAGSARTPEEYHGARSGPAQVATDKYRRNFDMIFMSKGGSA